MAEAPHMHYWMDPNLLEANAPPGNPKPFLIAQDARNGTAQSSQGYLFDRHGTCHFLDMRTPLSLLLFLPLITPALSAQNVGGGWVDDIHYNPLNWGSTAVTSPGDVNGDGRAEFLMTNINWFYAFSDVSLHSRRHTLWDIHLNLLVQTASPAGDINGDGVPDLLLGGENATKPSTSLRQSGGVVLISGSDGSVIDWLWGDDAWDHFGSSVATLGDVDGDMVSDFLVGASGGRSLTIPEGAVYLFSGADRRRILRVSGTDVGSEFGWALAPLADWDGDQRDDFVVGSPGHLGDRGRISIHSSATGSLISEMVGGAPGGRLGHALHSGAPTVSPGSFLASAPLDGFGLVLAVDSSFRVMWRIEGKDPAEAFGTSLVMTSDLDGDNCWDFLVGRAPRQQLDFISALEVQHGGLLSSGKPIWTFALSSPLWAPESATVDLGDWNGDQLSDFASSALQEFEAHSYVYTPFLSATKASISASAGGAFRFDLDFLPDEADKNYAVLLSLGGTGPSELLGIAIPLTVDPLFLDCLAGYAPNALERPYGRLNLNGDAGVIVRASAGAWTPLIGRTVYAAAITYDTVAEPRYSSAAVGIEILP